VPTKNGNREEAFTIECAMMETAGVAAAAAPKTLQIGLYSEGFAGIRAGLRTFPVSKLVVVYEAQTVKSSKELEKRHVEEFLQQLKGALDIEVEARVIPSSALEIVLDVMREIKVAHRSAFDEFLVNLSEGSKMLSCSALSCAFILGMRAFTLLEGGRPYTFPVLKLGYYHAISDAKLSILKAIQKREEAVGSLDELANMTGNDKGEVSRHINGSSDSRGLLELGLVTVERHSQGRLAVSLSPLGKILLTGTD
jgi:DNA-binding transcriptional ArsR family regulator